MDCSSGVNDRPFSRLLSVLMDASCLCKRDSGSEDEKDHDCIEVCTLETIDSTAMVAPLLSPVRRLEHPPVMQYC